MAKIDSAYAYYLSTYAADRKASRYDSHKKSDLRKIYNSIVKSNKDSPLYKIMNLSSAKRYAIDIKEKSKAIQNVVASLSDDYGDLSNAFQKKVAVSSDEDTVSVDYVGDGTEQNTASQFEIQINRLASPQVNTGNFLRSGALSFIPGAYSFDLNTGSSAYEFQYNVNEGDTNGDVVDKLARLVNRSNLGIDASVLENDDGEVALSLTSHQTGLGENETSLFTINPSGNSDSINAMKLLGINKITEPAKNSDFLLNGTPQTSLSNTFTVNNAFELTLKQTTSEDSPATIGFKTNTDAVADNIQKLVDAYNGILKVAENYTESGAGHGNRLLNDMSSVSKSRSSSLGSIGLMVGDDGAITIDRDVLAEAITPERTEETFKQLAEFRDAIGQKADNASVNPMKYVDKVIVEYKNPGHNFPAPYMSSIYSGMMLDSFI
jgi:flagellar hook-associated protein 2